MTDAGKQYQGDHDALRRALERSMVAIDDWLNTYAADLCEPARVEEASRRIGEYGTLSYIASVQEQNRAALAALLPEAKGGREISQHIGWLKQYLQGMDETNWKDMRLRAERQLEQLASLVSSTDAMAKELGGHRAFPASVGERWLRQIGEPYE